MAYSKQNWEEKHKINQDIVIKALSHIYKIPGSINLSKSSDKIPFVNLIKGKITEYSKHIHNDNDNDNDNPYNFFIEYLKNIKDVNQQYFIIIKLIKFNDIHNYDIQYNTKDDFNKEINKIPHKIKDDNLLQILNRFKNNVKEINTYINPDIGKTIFKTNEQKNGYIIQNGIINNILATINKENVFLHNIFNNYLENIANKNNSYIQAYMSTKEGQAEIKNKSLLNPNIINYKKFLIISNLIHFFTTYSLLYIVYNNAAEFEHEMNNLFRKNNTDIVLMMNKYLKYKSKYLALKKQLNL